MKKVLFSALFFLTLGLAAQAQLAQTKWKGPLQIPDHEDGWLSFKKDTLDVFIQNGDFLLESMTYTIVRDTMFLKKISGQSQCDPNVAGSYKWSLKDNNLYITPIKDDCDERFRAWTSQPFIKQ